MEKRSGQIYCYVLLAIKPPASYLFFSVPRQWHWRVHATVFPLEIIAAWRLVVSCFASSVSHNHLEELGLIIIKDCCVFAIATDGTGQEAGESGLSGLHTHASNTFAGSPSRHGRLSAAFLHQTVPLSLMVVAHVDLHCVIFLCSCS